MRVNHWLVLRAEPLKCSECSTSSGSHDISNPLGAFGLRIETLGDKGSSFMGRGLRAYEG